MSTKPNDGGPAFPTPHPSRGPTHGMTLRDWFFGMALSGIMARPQQPVDCRHVDVDRIEEYLGRHKSNSVREAVKEAMLAADEALAAREKGTK